MFVMLWYSACKNHLTLYYIYHRYQFYMGVIEDKLTWKISLV